MPIRSGPARRAPTYEEYVGVRWASLYRTAYLLTGSHPDADDLAQTTLVTACRSWAKIARAESPDAHVRRILTKTFLEGRRSLGVQREDLSEQQVTEKILADELRVVDGDLEVPVVPDAALLRERAELGTPRRRRRVVVLAGGGVAAAVIGAVLLGLGTDQPDGPSPVIPTPSPSYYADGRPYVQDFRLYVAHRQQAGGWLGVVQAGPFSVAEKFEQDPSGGTRVVAFRDGRRLTTGNGIRSRGSVRLSAGGAVAWLEATDGRTVVVAKSLVTGKQLNRVGTGVPIADDGDVQLEAVLDDGTVYYRTDTDSASGGFSWVGKPGQAPRRSSADAEVPEVDDTAGLPDEPGVRLGPDGLWGAWYSDPAGAGEYRSLTVQKPGDVGSRYTIPLPDTASILILGWSSPTTVETYGSDDGPSYTCDISTRVCTAIPDFS